MPVKDYEVRRLFVFALIIALFTAAFFIIRPLFISTVAGLLLAYAFYPVYKGLYNIFREKNTTALASVILIILVLLVPIWFMIPLLIQQAFDMFTLLQSLDIGSFVQKILPIASIKLQADLVGSISGLIGKITSGVLTTMTNLLFDLPSILLNLAVLLFVFFFGLRDADKLQMYLSEVSPLKKEQQKILTQQFKDMTSSIIYGQIVLGVLQGIITGVGLLLFGIPKVLLLTVIAVIAGVLPILGPWLVWIPAAIYLFSTGQVGTAIGFSLYSIIFASLVEAIIRPVIISRKTKVPSAVILIGTIGGLITFGTVGIFIGPLILAYLLFFLEAYKNKAIAELFSAE
jgi:predicted PurR-regulated permease PerM